MRILTRYFSKEFLKLFALFQFAFLSMYLIIEFVQKIDDFIEANAQGLMLPYLLYKAPYIINLLMPVTTLLSVIVMLSLMKKNHEITAMKASGMNILRISQPIIIVSVLISIAMFLFSELIVPYTVVRSNEIWNIDLNKSRKDGVYGQNCIWYKGDNSIYWVGHFDSKKNIMEDLTFYFFDASFRLIERIDAHKAIWNGNKWKIQEGITQKPNRDGGYDLKRFDEIYLTLPEKPEAFVRTVKSPEEMSYWQLKRYAQKVRAEGYDSTEYLVDMNVKLAFPLINVVMIFIGIPIALGLKRGGTPLAVFLGISVCFIYLVTLGFARALGISGVLPPTLSAWLANFIFFLTGIYMMMYLER